jgi:hypothetical protein
MRSVALAVAAVVGCVLTTGCGDSKAKHAAAINKVVQQDKAAHDQIAASIGVWDKIWGNPKKIALYAGILRNIDLSECPQDFQQAFLKHAYAWSNLATVAESTSGLTGFFRGLGGTDVAPEIQRAQREISDTWLEVDRIARTYGVNVNQ